MQTQKERQINSNPHQGWGHCVNCNTWSYFLSEQKGICPICDKKLKAQEKDKDNG